MKKKLLLSSAILQFVEVILLFTPFVLINKVWEEISVGHSRLHMEIPVNIFGVYGTVGDILAFLLISLLIVSAIIQLFTCIKKAKLMVWEVSFPIAALVILLTFIWYIDQISYMETKYWSYDTDMNWMFFVILVMNIIAVVLTVIVRKKFNDVEEPVPVIKQEVSNSNADELKKYKELLDSGIITQEEFDAKKKQLLGL